MTLQRADSRFFYKYYENNYSGSLNIKKKVHLLWRLKDKLYLLHLAKPWREEVLKNLSWIKEKEYCRLFFLSETSFHHYVPKQAVFYCSFNLPLLKPRHWICFFLHKQKSKTEIVPLLELLHLSLFKVKSLNLVFGYLALMWAKVLLVFLNISRQEVLSPKGPFFSGRLRECTKSLFGWQLNVWFQFALRHFSLLP